jgi:hypothetical protein
MELDIGSALGGSGLGELLDPEFEATEGSLAVEWGKKAARRLLDGGDFEEADAVADKRTYTIE